MNPSETLKERFTFRGHSGAELSATLERPKSSTSTYALLAHCFTCGKGLHVGSRISAQLASKGIAVVRFDFTGIGESGGEFGNTNFSSNVEDLILAADHMREQLAAPKLLIGHSLGGAAITLASREIPETKAMALLAAPSEPEHVLHLLEDQIDAIEADGAATVSIGGRSFHIKRQFIEDLRQSSIRHALENSPAAVLILHSPGDQVVPIRHAAELFEKARHPKSFISLDRADHLLSDRETARYAGELIAVWSSRYLE